MLAEAGKAKRMKQFDRALFRARIKDVLHVKRTKGERLGGLVPYGKTVAADGKMLITPEADAKRVPHSKRLCRADLTVRVIATKLTTEGTRTKRALQ
jgi:hypothetical protein